jgi:hypothetical protein
MEPNDITVELLKEIRGELRGTNLRLDELTGRLDETNDRLDLTNDRLVALAQRVVESEVRTATAIADLAGSVREMTQVLRASHDLRPRVERCEQDIADIKRTIAAR